MAMEAHKLLANGYMSFLANMVDKSEETKMGHEEVPIIREFVDMFLEDLLGLPPKCRTSSKMGDFFQDRTHTRISAHLQGSLSYGPSKTQGTSGLVERFNEQEFHPVKLFTMRSTCIVR